MSEKPKPSKKRLPRYDAMSTDEAYDVAHAEEGFRLAIEHARQMGQLAVLRTLKEGQEQASLAASEPYHEHTRANRPETNLTPDKEAKIKGWLQEGLTVLHTWLGPNSLPPYYANGVSNRYATLYSNRARALKTKVNINYRTPGSIKAEYAAGNADELVTVTRWDDTTFAKINPSSPKANEKLVRIAYDTLNELGSGEGNGNSIGLTMHLPESDAEEAMKMIREDPASIRQVADVYMESIGGAEAWSRVRPSYENWQAMNGGMSHMAIREGALLAPQPAQIVTFQG